MAYAMYSKSENGNVTTLITRESEHSMNIKTVTPLTDDQMKDLYWIVELMTLTGKTLTEILNRGERDAGHA